MHRRVNQAIQRRPSFRLSEDAQRDVPSVDPALPIEGLGAEDPTDLSTDPRVGESAARQSIGVQDARAESSKHSRDRGLSAGDTGHDADDHRRTMIAPAVTCHRAEIMWLLGGAAAASTEPIDSGRTSS